MRCQKCENTAVYTRKYSGESLCSECFSNSILRKAAKTISKYKMIKNDELVVVGVSGGKDSLVLLSILKKMSETHNFKIIAVTIDEGIPGYRDEALEIVKDFAYYWNMSDEEYIRQNPKLEKTIKWSDKNRPYLYGGALVCFVFAILIWFA